MILTSLRPADFDPDTVKVRKLGDLMINTVNGDLYAVIQDPITNEKKVTLVGGSAKYEIGNHIATNNIMKQVAPIQFDAGTTWYRTDLIYQEMAGGDQDAFITIRTDNDTSNPKWATILPITKVNNVFLGRDGAGNLITLGSLIKKERMKIVPSIDVNDAEFGEIYIKDDNSIWFKKGHEEGSDRLLANATTFSRELLVKSIEVANNAPANFDKNTIYIHPTEDADVSLASTAFISTVNDTSVYGLKFVKDRANRIQQGATISNQGKTIVIDNNVSNDTGHTWLNYPIKAEEDVYFELDVYDPDHSLSLLLLKNGVTQEMSLAHGTTDKIIKINSTGYKYNNNDTAKNFPMHNRTIFGIIKLPRVGISRIYLGYVNDDGTLNVVYGNDTFTTDGINIDGFVRIGVTTAHSNTPNSKSRIDIKTYRVNVIPNDLIAINNVLPNEDAFSARAIATNANSIFLSRTVKLSNFVHNGRLVIGLRDVKQAASAALGEIMLDYDNKVLYAKLLDGTVVDLRSKFETVYQNHIENSFGLTTRLGKDLLVNQNDLTISYVTVTPFDIYNSISNVVGNLVMVDNLETTDRTQMKYKQIIPRTRTNLVRHKWLDINNDTPIEGNLDTYLDSIHAVIKLLKTKKNVYSSYLDLMTAAELSTKYFNQGLFFKEIVESRRMVDHSMLIQQVGTDNTNTIDRIFNSPVEGIAEVTKTNNRKATVKVTAFNGTVYTAKIKNDYTLDEWVKMVSTYKGMTTVDGKMNITGNVTGKDISSDGNIDTKNIIFKNTIESNITFNNENSINGGSSRIIGISGSNVTRDLSVKIGDDKTNITDIYSKERPRVIGDGTSTVDDGNRTVLKDDLKYMTSWKGKLNTGSNWVDLNTLINKKHVGYWTADGVLPNGYNYPRLDAGEIYNGATLDVKLTHIDTNLYLTQILIPNVPTGKEELHSSYTRTMNVSTGNWTKWVKSVSRKELDSKFDKTGGVINGAVTVKNDFITKGGVLFEDGNIRLNQSNFNILAADLSTPNITTTSMFKYENGNLLVGSAPVKTLSDFSVARPTWVTTVPQYGETVSGSPSTLRSYTYNYAMTNDIDVLANNIRDNYHNKVKTDEFLKTKADKVETKDALDKKYDKAGGELLGDMTLNDHNIILKGSSSAINLTSDANLYLPTKSFSDLTEVDSFDVRRKTRYDLVELNNKKHGLITIGANYASSTFNDVTSVQFLAKSDGDFQIRNIIGGTNKEPFKSVFFKNDIYTMNTFFTGSGIAGGENKVVSAEVTKNIYNSLVSEYRGNISSYITDRFFDINNLLKLQPGNYYVNSQDSLTALGLDTNIFSPSGGVLVVMSDYDNTANSIKVLRYLPSTSANTAGDDKIAELIATNGSASRWMILCDYRSYYTKTEMDRIVERVNADVTSKVISTGYSFTGNTTNTAKPEVLVHTHNHPTDGNEVLFFKTNLSTNELNSGSGFRYKIRLNGESLVNGDIDIVVVGELKVGSDSQQPKQTTYNKSVGSTYVIEAFVKDSYVWFSLKVKKGTNDNLSFDTYIRLSNIPADTTFVPKVLQYTTTDPR